MCVCVSHSCEKLRIYVPFKTFVCIKSTSVMFHVTVYSSFFFTDIRAQYKDLIWLLKCDTLIANSALRTKVCFYNFNKIYSMID